MFGKCINYLENSRMHFWLHGLADHPRRNNGVNKVKYGPESFAMIKIRDRHTT